MCKFLWSDKTGDKFGAKIVNPSAFFHLQACECVCVCVCVWCLCNLVGGKALKMIKQKKDESWFWSPEKEICQNMRWLKQTLISGCLNQPSTQTTHTHWCEQLKSVLFVFQKITRRILQVGKKSKRGNRGGGGKRTGRRSKKSNGPDMPHKLASSSTVMWAGVCVCSVLCVRGWSDRETQFWSSKAGVDFRHKGRWTCLDSNARLSDC